jgi:hypothetical protein
MRQRFTRRIAHEPAAFDASGNFQLSDDAHRFELDCHLLTAPGHDLTGHCAMPCELNDDFVLAGRNSYDLRRRAVAAELLTVDVDVRACRLARHQQASKFRFQGLDGAFGIAATLGVLVGSRQVLAEIQKGFFRLLELLKAERDVERDARIG